MRLRGLVKRVVYGEYFLYRGWFPYFGQAVFFPAGSCIFLRACAEGIYEQQITNLLTALIKPNTTFIDIGANIGLLSIPVLVQNAAAQVVSIEASPETFQHLRRTWVQCQYRDRWRIISSAVGGASGEATFWTSAPANGAFDGLSDTGRGGAKQVISVNMQTLDQIWEGLNSPTVSVVKIDVEGAERDVLAGGRRMIAQERPVLVIEWSRLNLPAYGIHPGTLLDICRGMNYQAYSYPNLCLIEREQVLEAAMAQTETFLLVSKCEPTPPNALPNAR